MEYQTSTTVRASAHDVWMILTDVERMPEWTPSMTAVKRLEPGPLTLGSTARIKQPRLPATTWRVVEITPLRSFSWTSRAVGVTTEARHALEPRDGGVLVTLTLRQHGPLAGSVGLLSSRLSRRYVDAELQGLKTRAEAEQRPENLPPLV